MRTSTENRQGQDLRGSQVPLGYKVFKLNPDPVYRLKRELAKLTGPLESYQAWDEKEWTTTHVFITKRFHEMDWLSILKENRKAVERVIGEFLYQKEPYLRIARPNRPEDNIGIHRDTDYGASKNEWVLWIPLTDAIKGAELGILPGSHLKDYEYTQEVNEDVQKGSDKHWLGFRYAPKRFSKDIEDQVQPIRCMVGEAILFNCACIHGQNVNKAPWTRFSIDVRVVNKEAEFTKARGMHGEIYASL